MAKLSLSFLAQLAFMIGRGVPHAYRFLFATIMVPPVILPFDPSSSLVLSETSDPQVELIYQVFLTERIYAPTPHLASEFIIPYNSCFALKQPSSFFAISRSTLQRDPGGSLRKNNMDLLRTSPRKSIFRMAALSV